MQPESKSTTSCDVPACCNSGRRSTVAGPAGNEPLQCEPDLSQFVRSGEVALDLGGAGERLAAAIGPQGRVISVVAPETPLAECRQLQAQWAAQLGYSNVECHRGRPQDLQLDLERFDAWLESHPARSSLDWLAAQAQAAELRQSAPLVASDTIDIVLARYVFNVVSRTERPQACAEIYRVLKRGGRVLISAIVSDERVPAALQDDPALWSTGVGGADREDLLLAALETAGFYGMEVVERASEPHLTIGGIEFCSIIVQAFKGKTGPCLERHQAVIYNGPWKAVIDDDGHTLYRGKRMAVCDKTFQIYSRAPYSTEITRVPPAAEVPLALALPFNCKVDAIRDPRETKSTTPSSMPLLQLSGDCGPSGCC